MSKSKQEQEQGSRSERAAKFGNQTAIMREAIAKITGKIPQSTDPDYLKRKLEGLKKRKTNGVKAADRYSDSSTVLSVSMHGAAKDATVRIAGGEQCGISELVRRALSEYAAKRGYNDELVHFGGAE